MSQLMSVFVASAHSSEHSSTISACRRSYIRFRYAHCHDFCGLSTVGPTVTVNASRERVETDEAELSSPTSDCTESPGEIAHLGTRRGA